MMQDDERTGDLSHSLNRVASALGVPVESFFGAERPVSPRELASAIPRPDLAQALALMHLFLRLNAPEARERCLAFVQREVDAEA